LPKLRTNLVTVGFALPRLLIALRLIRLTRPILQEFLPCEHWDALFNRLGEIVLANITLANMFALVGAIFFVATLLMQTMLPLHLCQRYIQRQNPTN